LHFIPFIAENKTCKRFFFFAKDGKFSSTIFICYNPKPIWVLNQRLSNSILSSTAAAAAAPGGFSAGQQSHNL
jgi:hypothetical protein